SCLHCTLLASAGVREGAEPRGTLTRASGGAQAPALRLNRPVYCRRDIRRAPSDGRGRQPARILREALQGLRECRRVVVRNEGRVILDRCGACVLAYECERKATQRR